MKSPESNGWFFSLLDKEKRKKKKKKDLGEYLVLNNVIDLFHSFFCLQNI